MRILVCGGRDYANSAAVFEVLDGIHAATPIAVVVQGGAMGADHLAREWAWVVGVPVETYQADWKAHGKAAGPLRNAEMLLHGKPDVVLAFPGGRGTADMVRQAQRAGVPIAAH